MANYIQRRTDNDSTIPNPLVKGWQSCYQYRGEKGYSIFLTKLCSIDFITLIKLRLWVPLFSYEKKYLLPQLIK